MKKNVESGRKRLVWPLIIAAVGLTALAVFAVATFAPAGSVSGSFAAPTDPVIDGESIALPDALPTEPPVTDGTVVSDLSQLQAQTGTGAVILGADITLPDTYNGDSPFRIAGPRVIDLNGHTITVSGNRGLLVENATLQNGFIAVPDPANTSYALTVKGESQIRSVSVTGGVRVDNYLDTVHYDLRGGATRVVMRNCRVTAAKHYAVDVHGGASLTIVSSAVTKSIAGSVNSVFRVMPRFTSAASDMRSGRPSEVPDSHLTLAGVTINKPADLKIAQSSQLSLISGLED